MSREVHRRVRRLEVETIGSGVRPVISSRPLSDEEWSAGAAFAVPGIDAEPEREMTQQEWEAEHCHVATRH